MASLLAWLKYGGARKSDGTPVSSGSISFYQPGTTTAATVYSDADGLVTLPQPVALDAGGRARVYCKAAVKAEVKDSAGVSVALEDRADTVNASQVEIEQAGITGTSLTTGLQVDGGRTDLQTVLTGFSATYKESATASTRTYTAAIGWAVTPQDFGALGNDAADDTSACQAAINRAGVSGKPLFIPPGVYRTYSPLTISASGVRVIGGNRDSSIIRNMSALTAMSITGYDVCLENFTITGAAPSATTVGIGVTTASNSGCVISRVSVLEHGTAFNTLASYQVTLQDCYASLNNYSGNCYVVGPYSTAINCRARAQYNTGFLVTGPFARVSHCYAYAWSTAAIGFRVNGSDNALLMCTMDTTSGSGPYGFQVDAVARTWLVACTSNAVAADLYIPGAATVVREVGNNFPVRVSVEASGADWFGPRGRVLAKNKTTNAGVSSFTWAPDPSKGEAQVLVYTGAVGAGVVVTVSATATTGLVDGQMLTVICHNRNGQTVNYAFNTQYSLVGTQTLATNNVMIIQFMWNGANWIPIQAVNPNTYTTAAAVW